MSPELRNSQADRPQSQQRRGKADEQEVGENSGKTPELLRKFSGISLCQRPRLRPLALELFTGLKCRAKFIPARRPTTRAKAYA